MRGVEVVLEVRFSALKSSPMTSTVAEWRVPPAFPALRLLTATVLLGLGLALRNVMWGLETLRISR